MRSPLYECSVYTINKNEGINVMNIALEEVKKIIFILFITFNYYLYYVFIIDIFIYIFYIHLYT